MDKKRKQSANGGALYAAIAVCLLAVGAGGWQFLRRDAARTAAESRTSAVSGPAAVTDAKAPDLEAGADAPDVEAGADTPSKTETPANTASDAAGTARNNAQPADSGQLDSGQSTAATAQSGKEETAAVSGNAVIPAETPQSSSAAESMQSAASNTGETQSAASNDGENAEIGSLNHAESGSTLSSAGETPDTGTARETLLALPLEGEAVTVFSMAALIYNETLRDWRTHDGIDIAAEDGTAVCAALDGTVESVTDDPLMGTTVAIRHEGELETVYACLADNVEIEAGDDVSAGQVIGFVGQSAGAEAALGPHLHFSVLENGEAADPSAYLP